MPELLTLPEAREAIGVSESDTSKNASLTAIHIPSTTKVVEDVVGPVIRRAGQTYTADGGASTVMLPTAVVSVQSVVEDGKTLTPGIDYTVDAEVGIITRGPSLAPFAFLRGRGSVVVTYTVGAAASEAEVPPYIKAAAQIVLKNLWEPGKNGARPTLGTPVTKTVQTPSGYLIPERAYELLKGGDLDVPGFA